MSNQSIGALWLKKAKTGTTYMSGVIEKDGTKIPIVVFKNNKEKDNQPDYRILESTPYPKPHKDTSSTVEGEGTSGVPLDSIF